MGSACGNGSAKEIQFVGEYMEAFWTSDAYFPLADDEVILLAKVQATSRRLSFTLALLSLFPSTFTSHSYSAL